MTRPQPEIPSHDESLQKLEVIFEYLGPRYGEFFSSYGLREPGSPPPADERTIVLGFACVYPPNPGEDRGRYMIMGHQPDVEKLPSRDELRQKIMSYEPRPGAADHQEKAIQVWDNPVSRVMVAERLYQDCREREVPFAFIMFGRTESENRLVAHLFHPPAIPSSRALEMIQDSVDRAMGEDTPG
jgi:hypothetical protein